MNQLGKSGRSLCGNQSLGPSFGVKGGAAGGGYAQVIPMEDINFIYPAISMLSPLPIICYQLLLTTICSKVTSLVSILGASLERVMDMNERALTKQ